MSASCLCWLHVGDLHARAEDEWQGVTRLGHCLAELQPALGPDAVDFIYLPGDNANEGEPGQYAQIARALTASDLPAPLQVIAGDHDFAPGDLAAFHTFLDALQLEAPPRSFKLKGRRILLLDVVSAGGGGPEFDLGRAQTVWLDRELDAARREDALAPVVLMHTFPADLAYDGAGVAERFARAGVALVDTGHTHYNEVINDGRVVYCAARSTAQIEEDEGAFGAAFVAVDGDQPSFRFRRTGAGWPFVMITSPADHRLQVRRTPLDDAGRLTVRTKVFGPDADARVTLQVLDLTVEMTPVNGETALWSATLETPWRELMQALPKPRRRIDIVVTAQTPSGCGSDLIRLGPKIPAPPVGQAGAAGGSIGAWPEHGLLATRLGPNAYGQDW